MNSFVGSQTIQRVFTILFLVFVPTLVCIKADESDTPVYFDIPVQSLDVALMEFSEQASIQLLTSTELLENLQSRGISGRYFPEDALAVLMMGSGLTFQLIGDNSIAVTRISNSQKEPDNNDN